MGLNGFFSNTMIAESTLGWGMKTVLDTIKATLASISYWTATLKEP